jgi:hypothetical protein
LSVEHDAISQWRKACALDRKLPQGCPLVAHEDNTPATRKIDSAKNRTDWHAIDQSWALTVFKFIDLLLLPLIEIRSVEHES